MKIVNYAFAFLFVLVFTDSYSQRPGKADDRIESFKIAFITKRLDLSSDEATKFWPIYNQYQEELKTIREKNKKELLNAHTNIETMSDNDINKVLDDWVVFKQNELNLTKKFLPQFKSALPVRKVAKLFKAEEDFKSELIKRIQQNNK
ncbi:MAG: hypothetical protein WCL14_04670 [Bacteroidota bacterium]